VALAAGLLVAVTGVVVQSGTLGLVGFVVFLLAIPIGKVVNWRVEPHGALRRTNGALVLTLKNVHPDFAAAEEKSLRQALEQGNWPPGFIGPALVPLRFREPLAEVVRSLADDDSDRLVKAGFASSPVKFGDPFVPLPPEAWDMAQCSKIAAEPGAWWVVVPLWTARGVSDRWLTAAIREKDGELAMKLAIPD
jgi:hypothetical protein